MKKILLVMLLITLSGCAHYMTDDQISSMSNEKLCQAVQQYPTDQRLIAFMDGRKLQCHPVQITCKKAGFKVGSREYNNCTSKLINAMMADAAEKRANARAYGAALLGKNHVTNCQAMGNSLDCQSF